jgi:hypothetical protein
MNNALRNAVSDWLHLTGFIVGSHVGERLSHVGERLSGATLTLLRGLLSGVTYLRPPCSCPSMDCALHTEIMAAVDDAAKPPVPGTVN